MRTSLAGIPAKLSGGMQGVPIAVSLFAAAADAPRRARRSADQAASAGLVAVHAPALCTLRLALSFEISLSEELAAAARGLLETALLAALHRRAWSHSKHTRRLQRYIVALCYK